MTAPNRGPAALPNDAPPGGLRAALYARVSTTQQADAGTVASQLAALRARAVADGARVPAALEFVDDGASGTTLVRPGLERLRDAAYAGALDRLYVLTPDRLARRYAYQVVLLEELERAGVEVVFLSRPLGQSAEDELLVQVQGMLAEYERAKLLERTRRGKRHAARSGAVSVLAGAPYGYHYAARYEVVPAEADVVRRAFVWVAEERATVADVCRRLERAGAVTRTGRLRWNRSTVREMLANPAYAGSAAVGRTRPVAPQPRPRPRRGDPTVPRHAGSRQRTEPETWIRVPVPAVVTPDLFAAVQEQLAENRRRVRARRGGPRYLLQSLIVCGLCGYAFHGRTVAATGANRRGYVYYRCNSANAGRRTGEPVCPNAVVRAEVLDAAVWAEVVALLRDPGRVEAEYRRRLTGGPAEQATALLASLDAQRAHVTRGIARLIDGYADGLLERAEFEPRVQRLKQRAADLGAQREALRADEATRRDLTLVLGRLEDFAGRVRHGLDAADVPTRREIIRALVRRIAVHAEHVQVVFKVGALPFVGRPGRGAWPHCPDSREPVPLDARRQFS